MLQKFSVGAIEFGFTSSRLGTLRVAGLLMPASLPFGFRGLHLSSRDGRNIGKLRFGFGCTGALYIKRRLVQSCNSESGSSLVPY